mgnify:CR=1 FL=1
MKLIDESEADKSKDVFVGMWRPPFPEVEAKFDPRLTIGMRRGSQELRDAYLRGYFDEPLYKRILD